MVQFNTRTILYKGNNTVMNSQIYRQIVVYWIIYDAQSRVSQYVYICVNKQEYSYFIRIKWRL